MHPLGRGDKRALKLPLLGFNGVIDPDSGMYVARLSREGPSSNVAAIDRYRPKCEKKKYFRRFARASSTSSTRTSKCPLVRLESPSAFMYVPRASTATTMAHRTQPGRSTRMWFVVAFSSERISRRERSRSLKTLVKTTTLERVNLGFHFYAKYLS